MTVHRRVHRNPQPPPWSREEFERELTREQFGTPVRQWHPPRDAGTSDEAKALRLVADNTDEAAS